MGGCPKNTTARRARPSRGPALVNNEYVVSCFSLMAPETKDAFSIWTAWVLTVPTRKLCRCVRVWIMLSNFSRTECVPAHRPFVGFSLDPPRSYVFFETPTQKARLPNKKEFSIFRRNTSRQLFPRISTP